MSVEAKPGVTRRQLVGAGAGAGAALLASGSLGRALAAGDPLGEQRLRQSVEHVVVLSQENRSFDEYFAARCAA